MSDHITPETVTLRMTTGARRVLVAALPILFVIFLVGWFLLSSLLGAFGLHGWAGKIVGLLGSAVLCVVLWKVRMRQVGAEIGDTTLTLGPAGLVRENPQGRAELAWESLRGVEKRNAMAHAATPTGVNLAAGIAAEATKAASRRTKECLIGDGVSERRPGLNLQNRKIADNVGLPPEGRREQGTVFVFPGDFEADWRSGTIGDFLRRYRPDLAATGEGAVS